MKTKMFPRILFAAALACFLAASLPAAPRRAHPTAYPVDHITRDGAVVIKIGTADSTVCRWLGTPIRKILDDVWVYPHFRASLGEAQDHECGTLLVTITRGRVAQILLVNDRALKEIAAMMPVHLDAGPRVFIATQ